MEKVLWRTIYTEFYNNNLFNPESCKIGQNLLLPYIKLRVILQEKGIQLNTFDIKNGDEKLVVINELSKDIFKCCSFIEKIKYILKRKWRKDPFLWSSKKGRKRILVISEPEVVCPLSYQKKYHKFFDKIFTWNDDLVDNKKYFKYFIPQVKPDKFEFKNFNKRKFLTNISSNKTSQVAGELYSKRYDFIKWAVSNNVDLDVYGYGWDKEDVPCYRGSIKDKLDTLSNYKFSLCFENVRTNGYITEKIFDCFFAGTIPIYLGAPNIEKYIPCDTYIDASKFDSYESLVDYIKSIDEKTFKGYLDRIKAFLNSPEFENNFSFKAFAKNMADEIEKEIN